MMGTAIIWNLPNIKPQTPIGEKTAVRIKGARPDEHDNMAMVQAMEIGA